MALQAEYLTFEGRIEPMIRGGKTYTILPLPEDVAQALHAMGARRVEGEIADHPINLALTTAPETSATFLWTGQSFLQSTGLSPGAAVDVRLRPAPEDAVETPPDLSQALFEAELSEAWEALPRGRRRGLIHQIGTAKRPETRAKRIANLIAGLR